MKGISNKEVRIGVRLLYDDMLGQAVHFGELSVAAKTGYKKAVHRAKSHSYAAAAELMRFYFAPLV